MKDSKFTVKSLKSLLDKASAERQVLAEEQAERQKQLALLNDKIKGIRERIKLLEQVNSEPVSEHAVLRYCERVLNIDVEDIKKQLKELGEFFIEKMEDGIVKTKIDGKSFTIKISNGKVVTIIKNKKLAPVH